MDENIKIEVDRWIAKAENDLENIRLQIRSKCIIGDTACFHAQQAVEKYLKAYLVSKQIEPERTHKIEKLLEACSHFDSEFEEYSYAVRLTQYAVETRYPTDITELDESEVMESFEIATSVRKFILRKLVQ